ncbi:MAG: hypothetical protein Q8Q14_02700 [Gemmatimonadales bacterium]|nr:hypothetical protein [Gemmatimonadales bacterium]
MSEHELDVIRARERVLRAASDLPHGTLGRQMAELGGLEGEGGVWTFYADARILTGLGVWEYLPTLRVATVTINGRRAEGLTGEAKFWEGVQRRVARVWRWQAADSLRPALNVEDVVDANVDDVLNVLTDEDIEALVEHGGAVFSGTFRSWGGWASSCSGSALDAQVVTPDGGRCHVQRNGGLCWGQTGPRVVENVGAIPTCT